MPALQVDFPPVGGLAAAATNMGLWCEGTRAASQLTGELYIEPEDSVFAWVYMYWDDATHTLLTSIVRLLTSGFFELASFESTNSRHQIVDCFLSIGCSYYHHDSRIQFCEERLELSCLLTSLNRFCHDGLAQFWSNGLRNLGLLLLDLPKSHSFLRFYRRSGNSKYLLRRYLESLDRLFSPHSSQHWISGQEQR